MYIFLLDTSPSTVILFFFNDTATTEIYTLSLHDALPISRQRTAVRREEDLLGGPAPGGVVELHVDDEELRIAVVPVAEGHMAFRGRAAILPVIGGQVGEADAALEGCDLARPVPERLHPLVVLAALSADAGIVVAVDGNLQARREGCRPGILARVIHRVAARIPLAAGRGVETPDLVLP